MKTKIRTCSALVVIALLLVLAEKVAARTVQLPPEPIAPTSFEQCNSLSMSYLTLTRSLREQVQSCYSNTQPQAPVGSGCSWTVYPKCHSLRVLICDTEAQKDRAVTDCRSKVIEHQRRANQESQRVREQQQSEQDNRWMHRSDFAMGSSDRQLSMMQSVQSNAKSEYLSQLTSALRQTSLGPYMRGLDSFQSTHGKVSSSVDFLGNVKHAGAFNAARTWFDRNANLDNLLASVTGRGVGSVQNPVVRMIMGTSLGVLLDHQQEMLRLGQELEGQMSSVSAGQTFAWQTKYQLHSTPFVANGHDPAQELHRALEQVAASIAKEHQVRAAENRQVMANAAEARQIEEARRQRAEMARAAEAARQSQARAAEAARQSQARAAEAARQQERNRAAAREADRRARARAQAARDLEDYEHEQEMDQLRANQEVIENVGRQFLMQQQLIQQQLIRQQQIRQQQQRTPSSRSNDYPHNDTKCQGPC